MLISYAGECSIKHGFYALFSGQSPVFRYCELHPIIANARLFTKNDIDTFNAPIINKAVIQFGEYGICRRLFDSSMLIEKLHVHRNIWKMAK